MLRSTMLPVNEPTPNTTSPGLPALIRIPVARIIERSTDPVNRKSHDALIRLTPLTPAYLSKVMITDLSLKPYFS